MTAPFTGGRTQRRLMDLLPVLGISDAALAAHLGVDRMSAQDGRPSDASWNGPRNHTPGTKSKRAWKRAKRGGRR